MRPIVLLLGCALLAACGSDDGGLSADEYRAQSNELCAEANREVKRLQAPTSPIELANFLERGLELGRKYDQRQSELEPPDELEKLHAQGERLTDRLNREFEQLIEDVRQADDPFTAFQLGLQELLPEIQEADNLNRRLKLDECLEVPGLRGTGPGPV